MGLFDAAIHIEYEYRFFYCFLIGINAIINTIIDNIISIKEYKFHEIKGRSMKKFSIIMISAMIMSCMPIIMEGVSSYTSGGSSDSGGGGNPLFTCDINKIDQALASRKSMKSGREDVWPGADINLNSMEGTALVYAIKHCPLATVKHLVKKGANVNQPSGFDDTRMGSRKQSPLDAANSTGKTDIINYLKSVGAH